MNKLRKHLLLMLALAVCAGVFLFPMTAYAVDDPTAAETVLEAEFDASDGEPATDEDVIPGEDADTAQEETESVIPPYDGPMNLTPDGSATVTDNIYVESTGLEFFTFTTAEGNVFYLIVDRLRTQDNVYFLNAVTEQDLLALAEKDGGSGTSVSSVPPVPDDTTPDDSASDTDDPEQPPAGKGGMSSGTLIFILIGAAAVGIAGYYFKILRPKQQRAADDDDADFADDDDYIDYGDGEDDYGAGKDDPDAGNE